jgi:hypothetical protein
MIELEIDSKTRTSDISHKEFPMDEYVVCPPEQKGLKGHPFIYLAGPMHGAPNWQRTATTILRTSGYREVIVSPRFDAIHESMSSSPYGEDLAWRHFYIKKALMRKGAILFWLTKEVPSDPSHAHAGIMRFELGLILGHLMHEGTAKEKTSVVVGVEEGFLGEHYVRENFKLLAPHVPFVHSLEDACRAAAALARNTAKPHSS